MGKRKGQRGVRGLRSALEELGEKALFSLSHPLPHCCPRACGWEGNPQGHFRSTHCFPPSSYSCLEIHICWKVPCVRETTSAVSCGFISRLFYYIEMSIFSLSDPPSSSSKDNPTPIFLPITSYLEGQ